jgi:hypothetical protein
VASKLNFFFAKSELDWFDTQIFIYFLNNIICGLFGCHHFLASTKNLTEKTLAGIIFLEVCLEYMQSFWGYSPLT